MHHFPCTLGVSSHLLWLTHQQGPHNKMQASDLDTSEPSRNRERKSIGLVCNTGNVRFAELPKYCDMSFDVEAFYIEISSASDSSNNELFSMCSIKIVCLFSGPRVTGRFSTDACSDSIQTNTQHVDLAREYLKQTIHRYIYIYLW